MMGIFFPQKFIRKYTDTYDEVICKGEEKAEYLEKHLDKILINYEGPRLKNYNLIFHVYSLRTEIVLILPVLLEIIPKLKITTTHELCIYV